MSADLDLEPIRARIDAATKGPWSARELPQMVRGAYATLHSAHGTGEVWSTEFQPEIGSTISPADAEFISHARQDIPALVAEVERLQGIVERVTALRDEMGEGKAFTILTMGKESDYPISYFLEYLDDALEGE